MPCASKCIAHVLLNLKVVLLHLQVMKLRPGIYSLVSSLAVSSNHLRLNAQQVTATRATPPSSPLFFFFCGLFVLGTRWPAAAVEHVPGLAAHKAGSYYLRTKKNS